MRGSFGPMHVRVVASMLVGLSSVLPAQSAKPGTEEPIIVEGNPSERFRIPEPLRRLPAERTERWRNQVNRDLGCQHVGPRGCGTPVVPIFTLKADGSTQVGSKPEPE